MFVSIIIPNYNHAAFLEERINSVLNQTYQNFELIILDDASTDNSTKIIDVYKNHPKVSHTIINKENSGSTFLQWQKGLAIAKGDLVWIAESDDVAMPSLLDTLLPFFQNNPACQVAYSATEYINENGLSLGINSWASALDATQWQDDFEVNGLYAINHWFKFRNIIPNASAVLFKKTHALSVVRQINERKMRYAGDWYFWSQLVKHGDLAYHAKVLNFQRDHVGTTRNGFAIAKEIARVKEYLFCIITVQKIGTYHKVDWFNPQYDWLFDEFTGRVPFSDKLGYLLCYKTQSLQFLKRLRFAYEKFNITSS